MPLTFNVARAVDGGGTVAAPLDCSKINRQIYCDETLVVFPTDEVLA